MRRSVISYRQLALLRSLHFRAGNEPKAPLAFVFDIDGVLIRGGRVLPEAKQALAAIYESGEILQILPDRTQQRHSTVPVRQKKRSSRAQQLCHMPGS